MVGGFPPPVGGAAMVNEAVFRSLLDAGLTVTKVNVAAKTMSHRRTLAFHAQRIARNLSGLLRVARMGAQERVFYISPDAGAGSWYSLAHVVLGARRYGRLVIHHHSCRYIEAPSRPIRLITSAFRARTTHVFETPGAAEAFQDRYGRVQALIASNARFVSVEPASGLAPRSGGPIRLGHLSNLCRDKGFFTVADAFDAVIASGIEAELWLAGPVQEPEVQVRLEKLKRDHGAKVRHFGPVAGEVKGDFYRGIDLFLFPTQFSQESAPIVIYEALAAGVPVLSTEIGRIPEVLSAGRGAICKDPASFGEFAVAQILGLGWDAESTAQRSHRIKDDLRRECERSEAEYDALLRLLGVAAPPE